MKIVYLVESGRDDPVFEALLSSKQAALAMLAANNPGGSFDGDWQVRAIQIDGEVVGSAAWTREWTNPIKDWHIWDGLP